MIPELGSFAIVLALCFSLIQSFSPLLSPSNRNSTLQLSMIAVIGQFLFLALAMFFLIVSFLKNDLSVIYVREHSHHLLPLIYRIGAAWGGHEGSLLLWCLMLGGWTLGYGVVVGAVKSPLTPLLQRGEIHNKLPPFAKGGLGGIYSRTLTILGLISSGFIAFLFITSNPFKRDFPSSLITGNDLTPILQDPGLIFHPPMLYLGYVGFAIGFAFAISSLIEGKLEKKWAETLRPWIILPWSFLSCGIVLGSWWAYRELGWGGWWFWDPVENASLLPWLSATALLHSLIVSEKRDAFKGWTILLAIITFTLSLLGTFLVRSGVLVSVHAFASDPTRGVFLLLYLAIVIGSAFILYGFRIKYFYRPPHFHVFSRETFLLINSVFLITAVATIVIGTLYPIILDALEYGKISVGEPYFNSVFVPIILPLLLLMGLVPHVQWGQQSFRTLWKKCHLSFFACLVMCLITPWFAGFPFHIFTAIGIFFSLWVIVSTIQFVIDRGQFTLQHSAMVVAHLGIAILALGITVNKSYSIERQVKMQIGETVTLAGNQFTFKNITETNGPNYRSLLATFTVQHNSQTTQTLSAEQRIYPHDQTLSKTGILVNAWRDLYLALGGRLPDGGWSVRIYYKPFVRWIWFGGFMLLAGGMLSLLNHLKKRGVFS